MKRIIKKINWYKIIIETVLITGYIISLFGSIIIALCLAAELPPESWIVDITLLIVCILINAVSGHCIRWYQENTDNVNDRGTYE